MSYLWAILGLCLLIVVHEAGHMWVARLFGMRVEKFSIFFGPTIWRWRGKETVYQLATIPLGGYVQIAGMNPHEQIDPADPGSYMNKSVWARFATISAGPVTNYLCAIFLMWMLLLVWGAPQTRVLSTINAVQAGQPAADAGLRTGDHITSIDGHAISSGAELIALIGASKGAPLQVGYLRGQHTADTSVIPAPAGSTYRIGITLDSAMTFADVSFGRALWTGLSYPIVESLRILDGLRRMVTREVSTDQVGGLVEVVRQLKIGFEHSFPLALGFLAMLNVVLGLFNLLPIPALDGGRLVFLIYNILTGRMVNQRFETIVHTIGFVLLMGLLILVNARDIARLITAE